MATLRDVAQLAGVTVTTVSRMLNGKGNVSEKTQRKIQQAMQALDYFPNEMARSLKVPTSSFIGLIVPSLENFYFASVAEKIEKTAFARGYRLLLCVTNMDETKERECYTMLMSNRVAGIIQCNQTSRVEEYITPGAPVVIIERVSRKQIPSVVADNYKGGWLAAEHLIERGCRRLAFLDAPLESEADGNRRLKGFLDAARALGAPEPNQIRIPTEKLIALDFREGIDELFTRFPDTDGVGANDQIASALVNHCLRTGKRIPEEIRVVGYDDTFFTATAALPLTTIHQPIDEICAYAVDALIRQAAGEVIPVRTVLPVQLIQRSTT